MAKSRVEKIDNVWHWWCLHEDCGGTGVWAFWSLAHLDAVHHATHSHPDPRPLSRDIDETTPGGIPRIDWGTTT